MELQRGIKETWGGNRFVHYLDCGDDFRYMHTHMSKFKLYSMNTYSLLYENYTSIKLLYILKR